MAPSYHSIKTKGLIGTVKRFFNMRRRYGFSTKKMEQNVKKYIGIVEESQTPLTIFIPAVVLEKHSDFLGCIDPDIVEFGVHGHVHIDYRVLPDTEIDRHLKSAVQIFRENGFKPEGFRAPYLAWNEKLIKKLSENFTYDSSQSYDSGVLPDKYRNNSKCSTIIDYYAPLGEPEIKSKHGVTMIPVWLPDDEILVDRFGFSDKDISRYWIEMAKSAFRNKYPLVIQLHPERISFCERALRDLIKYGREHNAEFLKLSTLAAKIPSARAPVDSKRYIAITGDLDMLCLQDRKTMKRELKHMGCVT